MIALEFFNVCITSYVISRCSSTAFPLGRKLTNLPSNFGQLLATTMSNRTIKPNLKYVAFDRNADFIFVCVYSILLFVKCQSRDARETLSAQK